MRQETLAEDLVFVRRVPLHHPSITDVMGSVWKIHRLAQVATGRLLVVLAWLPFRHDETWKRLVVKVEERGRAAGRMTTRRPSGEGKEKALGF